MNDSTVRDNVKNRSTWLRGFWMIVLTVIYSVAELVLAAVAVFQFFSVLFTSRPNENLLAFGRSLSTYIYQLVRYFTFNQDERPFPFARWPDGTEQDRDTAA